jgi:hypothetical protein
MAMAMAMGAASKTTMAVTMSMPSRTRTMARRATSGTREVRARVDDDDDARRRGSARRVEARLDDRLGDAKTRARRMEEGDDDDDDEGEADEGRRRDARTPLASALLVVLARAHRSRRLEPRSRRSR